MRQLAFSIGSNLGNRTANLQAAVARLARYGEVRAVSAIYDNPAVGFSSGNRFYNQCIILKTDKNHDWKTIIAEIEKGMGRVSSQTYTDRVIDIDLLFCLPENVLPPGLEVPHPRMKDRHFVLLPLLEIMHVIENEGWIKKVEEWSRQLPPNTDIYKIEQV